MPSVTGRGQHTCAPALLAACIQSALLLSPAFPALAQETPAQVSGLATYDLPAQPLTSAIQQYSRISGVQVIFDTADGTGVRSAAVQGRFDADTALRRLLAGTPLVPRRQGAGTFHLEKAPAADSDVMVTSTLSVEGVGMNATGSSDANASEGSGRYATPAASTATKLNLSLRQTPQSVTVVTRQRLDDMAAQSLNDVMGEVTGIVVTQVDSERTSYMSRGYSISTFQVDGVNTSFSNGYVRLNSDPAIYDRVEVLRGAAGQTVGAGDPGGTVNQVRKRPGDVFAASFNLGLGRWNNHRMELDVGGPLAFDGHLRGRLVAVKQQSDSFRDWYTSDKNVFYGILEADLGPSTLLSVGYDHQTPKNSGITYGTIPYWLSDGSLANMPRSFNPAARWSQWNIESEQRFARIEQRLGDEWTARLTYTRDEQTVTGQRWFGADGYFPNADGTGKSAWYGGGNNFANARSWDADLNGVLHLFGREHALSVGYHHDDTRNHTPASYDTYPDDFFDEIPDWRNWDGRVPRYTRNYRDYDSSYTESGQSALYFSAQVNFADPLKAVVGARYGKWESHSYTYQAATGGYSRAGYQIDDVLTPYASLLYDVSRHFTVYASYTDIFTPQNARDYQGQYLDPIEGNHYELGLKGEFYDGDLNTSLSVFRSQKDNLAEIDDEGALPEGSFDPKNPPAGYDGSGYRFIPGTEEVAYRSTGKGNKIRGFEGEIQGTIAGRWNIAGGFTRLSMEDKNGAAINTYLPRNTLRLRTSYRFGGAWEDLSVGGGVTWQSRTWSDVNNVPTGALDASGKSITATRRIVQGDFYLVNLQANYRFNEHFSANLAINNVFDKSYYSRVGFYSGVMYGTPRDYRLNLRYTF